MIFDLYIQQSFYVVILLSALPLTASAVSGLVVSILQAATQIQEQTISFLARIASVSAVFIVLYRWYWSEAIHFIQYFLSSIVFLGKMP